MPAERRLLAGGVGVEAEVDPTGEPLELLQLALGQRRSHRRHGRLEPRLAERDHVRVPLDDDGALLLRDRRPGEVEAVEHRRLVEELGLGRVHVLAAQRVVLAQLPCLEADHAPARVGEREHQPRREVVVATGVGQARGAQLVAREALLLRLAGEAGARREAEPELAADLLAQPAAREVRAHRLTGGGIPQVALVERRRLVEQRMQPVTPLSRCLDLRRALLVLERDPEALREPLDRADEVDALRLPHERDHVAALAAAEAVIELVHRVDGEAGRPLLVEGAATAVARTGLAQGRAPAHHLDHVGGGDDGANGVVLDPRH